MPIPNQFPRLPDRSGRDPRFVELLVVAVVDLRNVVHCPHCGFRTPSVHDRRQVKVHDLPHGGRPTERPGSVGRRAAEGKLN